MTILGPNDGMFEVRLVKPPFDAVPRVYLDAYEKPGNPYPPEPSYECTRMIIPEDTTYAIEVTLKQGFAFGTYVGVYIRVHDKASKSKLGVRGIKKAKLPNILLKDQTYLLKTFNHAIVHGAAVSGVSLTLSGLKTGTVCSSLCKAFTKCVR